MITDVLYYGIIAAYIIRTVRMTFYYVFLWQLREYRMDRMLSHIRSPLGRKLLIGKSEQVKWFSFLLFIFALPLIYIVWLLESVMYIKELFAPGWHLPKMTPKAILIAACSLVVGSLPLLVGSFAGVFLLGPFIDRGLFYFVSLLAGIFNIPTVVWRQWMFVRAQKKRMRLKQLTVIGITGSYGKTSTKDYLATILGRKFRVSKTPEYTNTLIGIANHIVGSLADKHQVSVIEMGAYKKGEIRRICQMVQPQVGIITAIGSQHQDLFGSMENIQKAKFELFESLPQDGVAIINKDCTECTQLIRWAKKRSIKTIEYSPEKEIRSVTVKKDGIDCTLAIENKKYPVHLKLSGKQVLPNVLAAITAARTVGMDVNDIVTSLPLLAPPPQTMKIVKQTKNVTYVADTFNANPQGVRAVYDYMKVYRGKKILILTPLIELGGESESVHKQLGKEAAQVCDLVLLTNANFSAAFISGASEETKRLPVRVATPLEVYTQLQKIHDSDSIVVFEGKEAGKILASLRGTE